MILQAVADALSTELEDLKEFVEVRGSLKDRLLASERFASLFRVVISQGLVGADECPEFWSASEAYLNNVPGVENMIKKSFGKYQATHAKEGRKDGGMWERIIEEVPNAMVREVVQTVVRAVSQLT